MDPIILSKCTVGTHIGKRKTILETLEYAIYNCLHIFQFYLCSPRGYHVPTPNVNDVIGSRELLRTVPNARVFVHGCLLYNLCSSNKEQLQKTITNLQRELDIVSAIGGNGVVIHPGSCPNEPIGIKTISSTLNEILDTYSSLSENLASSINISVEKLCSQRRVLLECCAGEGNKLCKNLEQIQKIIDCVDKKYQNQVGICIDTAHLHAAGDWNLSTPKGIDSFFDEFEKIFGMEKLWCVHLNDSKVPFGAKKDRHAPIGQGTIFYNPLIYIHFLKRCKKIPMVMELPVPSLPYIEMSRIIYENLQ